VSKKKKDLILVSKSILPESIVKTYLAKELLAKSEVLTVNEACERVKISRSAYYKYKDGVFPFFEASERRIITLSLLLAHRAGVLSNVLNFIASVKGNILTINQGIPLQGVANVTISVETDNIEGSTTAFLSKISNLDGVKKIELIANS
jgi:chorismate mutase